MVLLATACAGTDTVTLGVDLHTDYLFGNEFSSIAITVDETELSEYEPGSNDDFGAGVRIALFEGLTASTPRSVRLELRTPSGGVLDQRTLLVDNLQSQVVSVVLSRRCAEVECSAGQACLAGRCVAEECSSGTESSCPEPECDGPDQCSEGSECTFAQCVSGVCLYSPDETRCDGGQACDWERGCSVPPPDTPAVLGPPSGIATESLWIPTPGPLQPQLQWTSTAGAESYELEMDDSCSPGAIASCTFPSPEVRMNVTGTSLLPSEPLPVATTPPVGQLYAWRVRACRGASCSGWSPVRYLDVGRSRGDFNGDGYADLAVSTRNYTVIGAAGQYVYVFANGATGLSSSPYATLYRSTEPSDDRYGSTMTTGDFNGDGFADLAVTASGDSSLHVYSGSAAGLENSASVLSLDGDQLGRWVDSADVDGDGYDDLWLSGSSSTVLLSGGATGLSASVTRTIERGVWSTGRTAALFGDVDGDGLEDLGIGDTNSGSVHIYGARGGRDSDWTITQPSDPWFGLSLGRVGDFDGDGVWDYGVGTGGPINPAVSAPALEGNVHLGFGGRTGLATSPELSASAPAGATANRYGWTLRSAGDLNGDGFPDLLVSAPDGFDYDGRIDVFFGGARELNAPDQTVPDSRAGDYGGFGVDVAVIDLAADGQGDLVVSAGSDGLLIYGADGAGGFVEIPQRITHPPLPPGAGTFGYFASALAPHRR